jgi:hypothetical protein
MVEAGEHEFADLEGLEQTVDGLPLQAALFLFVVAGADDRDDKIGMICIEVLQIEGEVAARKFGLVKLIVENFFFAKALRKNARDLRDKAALFPSERKRNAKPFSARAHEEIPLIRSSQYI